MPVCDQSPGDIGIDFRTGFGVVRAYAQGLCVSREAKKTVYLVSIVCRLQSN
jgi:hypothetical protein